MLLVGKGMTWHCSFGIDWPMLMETLLDSGLRDELVVSTCSLNNESGRVL